MNTKMVDIGSKPQANIPALVWKDNYWLAYGGQKTIPATPILSKSLDGNSWTPITQTLFDTVEGAVWSGSQWLFYGTDASENLVFATATNNLTLTQITSPFVSQYDVCSGIGYDSANSWFYAYGFVSSKSTLVVFSGSWSTKLSTTGRAITQVNIISSTKYLVLSSGLKVTSTIQNNSPTWESITYSNDTAINDILTRAVTLKLNSNTWIVASSGSLSGTQSYVVSNDQGSTWSLHSQFYSLFTGLTWNGTYWLAAVNTSAPSIGTTSKYSLVKSTDGITWTTSTVPLPDSLSNLYLIIYINSFWLIALKNGPRQRPSKNGPPILLTPPAHVILKSTDGLAYTNVNSPFDNTLGITYLAWNGSYLLAYGQSAATGNAYFISTVELPTVASPKVKTLSLIAPPTGIIPIPKPRTLTFTYMLGGKPTISITVLKSSIPTNYSQVRLNCVKITKGTNTYTRMTAMPLISGSYSANILLPYTVTLKDIVKFDLISLDGYKNRKWYTIAYLKRQRYVVV